MSGILTVSFVHMRCMVTRAHKLTPLELPGVNKSGIFLLLWELRCCYECPCTMHHMEYALCHGMLTRGLHMYRLQPQRSLRW